MTSKKLKSTNSEIPDSEVPDSKPKNVAHVVMADSVEAQDVPTVPIDSLKTISALQPEVSVHSTASTQAVSNPVPLVVQPAEYHRSLGEWMQIWKDGIRPGYLVLPLMPFLVGTTLAWVQTVNAHTPLGHLHLSHLIGTLIALLLLQIGANLVNDYYDYLHGTDTSNAFGPGGLIQQGLIKPTRVLTLGLAALGLGALIGIVVALVGGPLLYLFGLVGVLFAYFYSATARSLSSLALGELISFCVYGPLIALGSYIVQSRGSFSPLVLIYSLPLGLLAAAVILVNDLRDLEDDEHAGKFTLASLIGQSWCRVLYIVLLLAAYVIIAAMGIPHGAPHLILITFWTLPGLVIAITGILRSSTPASLHMLLRQTRRLAMTFAILLALALIVTAIFPVLPLIPFALLHM